MEWERMALVVCAAIIILLFVYCIMVRRRLGNALEKAKTYELMVRGAVHDLNNVLSGIIRAVEFLERDVKKESLRKFVKLVLHGSYSLAAMLDSLQNSEKQHFEVVDLASCLDTALELGMSSVSDIISVKKDYSSGRYFVFGNRAELENVILNLELNAVDAMRGGGTIELALRNIYLSSDVLPSCLLSVRPGDYVEVEFKDCGCGISDAQRKKIFEPFYSDKKCMSGFGLGLWNVRKIVEAHSGTLRVETSDAGTSFFIYLPLLQVEQEKNLLRLDAKILLVDDDKILAQLTSDMLGKCGANVVTVFSAEQALDIYSSDFDVVLLDVILPDMRGIEVLRELKRLNPDVKVLLMSGREWEDELRGLMEEDDRVSFVCKPCFANECVSKISNMLAK